MLDGRWLKGSKRYKEEAKGPREKVLCSIFLFLSSIQVPARREKRLEGEERPTQCNHYYCGRARRENLTLKFHSCERTEVEAMNSLTVLRLARKRTQ